MRAYQTSPTPSSAFKQIVRLLKNLGKQPEISNYESWLSFIQTRAYTLWLHSPDFQLLLTELTNFLPRDAGAKERFLYVRADEHSQRTCPCGTKLRMTVHGDLRHYCPGHQYIKGSERNRKMAESMTSDRSGRRAKAEATMVERYGVTNASKSKVLREKRRKTMNERFGGDSPFSSEEVRTKQIASHRKKYGVDYPSQTAEFGKKVRETSRRNWVTDYPTQAAEIKSKIAATVQTRYGGRAFLHTESAKKKRADSNLDRYGTEVAVSALKVRNKIKATNQARYGKDTWAGSDAHREYMRDVVYRRFLSGRLGPYTPMFTREEYVNSREKLPFRCNKCGTEFMGWVINGGLPRCPTCFPKKTSVGEGQVYEYVRKLLPNARIIRNGRKFLAKTTSKGKELDIRIPEKKLAIEYNGIYWHSSNRLPKTYHQQKSLSCRERGYRLIHVFEDDWVHKNAKVKLLLRSILGLSKRVEYARKCEVGFISSKQARRFCDKYHLQGWVNATHSIGLWRRDEFGKRKLLSVLTMGKPRFEKSAKWELLRYVAGHTSVVGGFQRMLKFFRTQNPGAILTYADASWSNGDVYERAGFVRQGISGPNYWYIGKGGIKLNRMGFQKHRLDELLESFDPASTEWENMQANGYSRVFDSGSWIFRLE